MGVGGGVDWKGRWSVLSGGRTGKSYFGVPTVQKFTNAFSVILVTPDTPYSPCFGERYLDILKRTWIF